MPRSLPVAVGLSLVLALAAAPFSDAKKPKPKHKVTIKGNYINGYKFKPKTITIKKNQKVTWSWNSDASHNVTFTTPDKHSQTAMKVSGFKITFKNTGTFSYSCTVHGFTGKVVVVKP
jgi:plastocyanin